MQRCRVNGQEIEGGVNGSGRNVYEQAIYVGVEDGVVIDGSCTCPMEYNCKHVAAVLFAYLEQPAVQESPRAAHGHATQLS